jgi:hypothetical protein
MIVALDDSIQLYDDISVNSLRLLACWLGTREGIDISVIREPISSRNWEDMIVMIVEAGLDIKR